jgi:small subunit ribosomal protein S14
VAKTSKINKNQQRKELAQKYAERRGELLAVVRNPESSDEERQNAYLRLRKMPRDASPVRYRLRCALTGRSRGNYRKFGICRNAFRQLALLGQVPGVRKASW